MIKLMVGSNFDPRLPGLFADMNAMRNNIRVGEVYGSVQEFKIFGSARPDFRLPSMDCDKLEKYVKEMNDADIIVNYTENTPIVDKNSIDTERIKYKLDFLTGIGVKRVTIAHPLAMEIVSNYSALEIEISTIYALKDKYQLRELKRRCPNITKICCDVARNRDFSFLIKLKEECDILGIELELLANEFCLTNCVDRVQCYQDHAQISTEAEASMFKRYPMGRCINSRMDKLEWLRARFILPQWMRWYERCIGITSFKITGRTHPTPYIAWITTQYLKEEFQGNLLELWADVRNIKRVSKGAQDFLVPPFEIDTNVLTEDFLWKYWRDQFMQDHDFEVAYLRNLLEPHG